MNSSRSTLFFAALVLALITGQGASMAAESQGAKPVAEEPAACLEKVKAVGRPHRISAVASLAAVRAWVQQAKNHGEEYTYWNEAESQSIKCEKLDRSEYFMCFATGKPCRVTKPGASDSKKAS